MEKSASLVLYYKDIEKILFDYYCGEYHPKLQKQIENTGKMLCSVKTNKGFLKTKKSYNFMLTYERSIEYLGYSIREQIDISLTDLCNIIDEKISDRGYKIDEIDVRLIDGFGEQNNDELNYLTLYFKKKEKVKIKKRGWKKHV